MKERFTRRFDGGTVTDLRQAQASKATVRQALAMFDQMLEEAREELSICDMDGRKIDPHRLRSLADDEQDRPG